MKKSFKNIAASILVVLLVMSFGALSLIPTGVRAAIGFDNVTSGFTAAGGTNATVAVAHTSTVGSTLLLICATFNDGNQNSNPTQSLVASSGNAPVKLVVANSGAGKDTRSEIWYQLAPPTGSSVTYTLTFSNINYVGMAISSWTGTDTVAPTISNSATGTSATISNSVTTVADNSFVLDCLSNEQQATVNAAQTKIGETTNQSYQWGAASYKTTAVTPAGSQAMSWTAGNNWAQSIVAFAPSTSAPLNHSKVTIQNAAVTIPRGTIYVN